MLLQRTGWIEWTQSPVEVENVDGRSVRQAKGHPSRGPLTTLSSFEKSKLAKVETPGTTYVHEWFGAYGKAVKVAVQGNPLSRVGSHLHAVRAHVLFYLNQHTRQHLIYFVRKCLYFT